MALENLIACASGSRRSCAAAVAVHSLHSADVVAVILPPETETKMALSIRKELEGAPGTRVVSIEGLEANGWRAEALEHASGPYWQTGEVRSVLLWHGVDALITGHPGRFEGALEPLRDALIQAGKQPGTGPDRLLMLGGPRLKEELDTLATLVQAQLRFRYLLVE